MLVQKVSAFSPSDVLPVGLVLELSAFCEQNKPPGDILCSWIVTFLGNQATAEEELDVNAKAEVAVCQSAEGETQQKKRASCL